MGTTMATVNTPHRMKSFVAVGKFLKYPATAASTPDDLVAASFKLSSRYFTGSAYAFDAS